MTALKQQLRAIIAETGPMPLARYMAECLSHPIHGYYMKQDPLGASGDFTTAPEISQMFGELIGLWIGDIWARQGQPKHPALIELGPGRGTLMTDIKRALAKVPGWPAQTPVHFVESSPALRMVQKAAHPSAAWYDDIDAIGSTGTPYIIANELFDALPIHQFEKTPNGWRERYVVPSGADGLGLAALASGPDITPLIPSAFKAAEAGSVLELCPIGQTIAQQIAQRIETSGGAALMIDYGYGDAALGDSFQAVQGHRYCDPFDAPGDADLTAHVNFQMLKDVGSAHCAVHGPMAQGAFLNALGLSIRAKALGGNAHKDAERLASPDQMGTLFKAISYTPHSSPAPAGF